MRFLHILLQLLFLTFEFFLFKIGIISPNKFGTHFWKRLERLDGVYIKVGQLLSVRPDIISFEIAEILQPLLKNVKSIPFKDIESVLNNSFPNWRNKILEIDFTPLSTGSIAQVHKVKLVDGTVAVIKVLKPKVTRFVETDLYLLKAVMKVAKILPFINRLPTTELIYELDLIIRKQLDLRIEANNLLQFRQNFSSNPQIKIPYLIKEIIFKEFIVLEYIDLPHANNYSDWPEVKRNDVAKRALQMLYQMMFLDGFTHCDLHPGNFFITDDGSLILIDFGITSVMQGEALNNFISFFYYMSINNGLKCAEIIDKTALKKSKNFNREKLNSEVNAFISEYSRMNVEQFSILSFTKSLISLEWRCKLKGTTSFINNILAIVFFESELKKLYPKIDFKEEAARYIFTKTNFLEFLIK